MTDIRGLSRRHTLTGLTAAGVGVPLLAACGADEETPTTATDDNTPAAEDSPTDDSSPDEGAAPEGGLAATGDIPVGGGTIFADEQVVVTQPAAGDFKAFTAVCTHQGCLVSKVTETIDCTCHGSSFSIDDGSVAGGPATAPLAEVGITVDGDQIALS
ncbi:Rieske (2Fe-2S) protein [Nocardioides sp.]|uniref:Rieske (2Fe-2S) protein n=1 Tax=Nocardioides sp. TaxID=35761 RepID=UPI002732FD71|nr:Rieske 2Fe-2S domain-containing protein [Nocardioides sp.]MDP3893778.1 Rieske 2Fe-2S domain-containing protein [Nocardioides sp.]